MTERPILVTGGAGFIGTNLVRALRAAGTPVTVVDDLSLGRAENLIEGARLIVGDVADPELWLSVPGAEAIVHLAGASSAPMFRTALYGCFRNNILGFLNVLEHARRSGARRVVYASTSSIYGNAPGPLREDGPIDIPNFYSVTKISMEQMAHEYHREFGLEVIGLRFLSVYGPWEDHKKHFANLVSQFIWDVEAGRAPVIYGDGSQTRDFTNVRDVVQAIRLCLDHPGRLGSRVFNVATGVATAVNEMARMIGELMEQPIQAEYVPIPNPAGYVREQVASLERIQTILGYCPTVTLREGIREILEWRRSRRTAAHQGGH